MRWPITPKLIFVDGTVFKLLLFVPELGKLVLIGGNLGFQFGNGFLFCHSA